MQWLMLLAAVGCNDPGFDGVTIRPTYGWVDGCTDVTIAGHGFDDGVSATLDGQPVTGISLPDPKTQELEVGYEFYAITPPHAVGFTDMVVTNGDGEKADVVKNAFYYVACIGAPHIDTVAPTDVAGGTAVTLSGCGFADGMQAQLVDPLDPAVVLATQALTAACATAVVSFEAPDLQDGTYHVLVVDAAGTVLYGSNPCEETDTGSGCEQPLALTYGGAT